MTHWATLKFNIWLYSHKLSTTEPNSIGDRAMCAYLNLNPLYLTETKINNAERILTELKGV